METVCAIPCNYKECELHSPDPDYFRHVEVMAEMSATDYAEWYGDSYGE